MLSCILLACLFASSHVASQRVRRICYDEHGLDVPCVIEPGNPLPAVATTPFEGVLLQPCTRDHLKRGLACQHMPKHEQPSDGTRRTTVGYELPVLAPVIATTTSWPELAYGFLNFNFLCLLAIYFIIRPFMRIIWYACNLGYLLSLTLKVTQNPFYLKPETLRTTFQETVMPKHKAPEGHTHGEAASDRSSASAFIDRYGQMTGLTPYYIQCSRADERNKRQGSRIYYWSKDFTTNPKPLDIPHNAFLALVDVDQYLDMPDFLARHALPTVIYTVQPDRVSKMSKNYSYTFDKDNNIHYNVTGGAYYKHMIWNYTTDHLMVVQTFMFIPIRVVTYLVDRKSTSPDHELVLLSPIGTWNGLFALLYALFISGNPLKRLNVVSNGFLRLMSSSLEGLFVSTGKPMSYASAYIKADIDDTIASVARTSQYTLTLPQVMSYVDGDRTQALPLLEYHRTKTGSKLDVVCPVPDAVRRYQYSPYTFQPEAKPSLVAFMTPLIHGAFAPDKTLGNERQCIDGRVIKARPGDLEMTPFLAKVMEEFVNLVIPESAKHSLHPVDDDEVLRRQHRPTQRRLFAMSHGMLPKRLVTMFQKAEAYANVKDPRAISIINPIDKREYSRYIYAFEAVLKSQSWYAFSHKPQDIAQRVVEILARANKAANTDFNRFDGHGSMIMRDLERAMLLRAFHPKHHSDLLEYHRSQYGLKAYATFGSQYDTEESRASGSPETSCFNTLVNSFTAYLSFRLTKREGLFIGPNEAYSRLGIYGGDDGLTADADEKSYVRAAKMIGQQLTIEPIQRGQPGIKFLARVYSPDVWFGDTNSMCDIKRQLSKFHTAVAMNNNVTPQMKFHEKLRCFSLSDSHTPVFKELCEKSIQLVGPFFYEPKAAAVSTYLSRFEKDTQYPNQPAEWMTAHLERELPEFEYKRFQTWVREVKNIEDLLKPPMFMGPVAAKSTIPVAIDGDVIGDLKIPDPQLPPTKPKKKTSETKSHKVEKKIPLSEPTTTVPLTELSDFKSGGEPAPAQQEKPEFDESLLDDWRPSTQYRWTKSDKSDRHKANISLKPPKSENQKQSGAKSKNWRQK